MKNVLFVLNFNNSFEGNFMRSILALSEQVENDGGKAVFLIPQNSRQTDWAANLTSRGSEVYDFVDGLPAIFKNTKTIKKIIEEHGGSIRAESEPGTGTKMIFSLRKIDSVEKKGEA